MTDTQASQIVAYLNACFPREALEPDAAEVWVLDLALLQDHLVARKAAEKIAHSGDRFPTIHEFRVAYRSTSEQVRIARPALEEARSGEIPEWVQVWQWSRKNGEDRWFPQQHENPAALLVIGKEHPNQKREQMDWPEYETVRERWLAANAPKAESIDSLLGV